MDNSLSMADGLYQVETRGNGLIVVRVASRRDTNSPLPDAVFSFRPGDPQYDLWERRLARQTAERQSD